MSKNKNKNTSKTYPKSVIKEIIRMHSLGYSSRSIAELLNIGSKSTVNRIINREDVRGVDPVMLPDSDVKILYIDIETLPCEALVFGRHNLHLSQDNIVQNGGQIVSVVWTWNDEEDAHGVLMTPDETLKRDDSRTIAELVDLLEHADVVIAQNGDRFDLPKIKTRMLVNGFFPPKLIKTVDTLKIAKQLGFPSNRLDALGAYLGLGRKNKHAGIDLWARCLKGDPEALEEMYEYNEQDVFLLRDVYKRIRAFDQRHINLGQYYKDDQVRCRVCGSTDVVPTGNFVYTTLSAFKEMQCQDCGHRSRTRQNETSKEKRKNTLMNGG